jgi:lipopolysaccharide export system protein LptA
MLSPVKFLLALLLVLVASVIAQDSHPAGRITATFYLAQRAAQRSQSGAAMPDPDKEAKPDAASMSGPFKVHPEAPVHIEADIVETSAGRAVFSGDVRLHQGDFLLRTSTLTAFYLGQSGLRRGDELKAEQLTSVEVKGGVIVASKGQTASGKWATLDVMTNTLLLGGGVVVTLTRTGEDPLKPDVAVGQRLKVDLTTGMLRFESDKAPVLLGPGMYRFEIDKPPASKQPAGAQTSPR